jgi:hypothetical protein
VQITGSVIAMEFVGHAGDVAWKSTFCL